MFNDGGLCAEFVRLRPQLVELLVQCDGAIPLDVLAGFLASCVGSSTVPSCDQRSMQLECCRLSTFLPYSFVIEEGYVTFIDFDMLQNWARGGVCETAVPSACASDDGSWTTSTPSNKKLARPEFEEEEEDDDSWGSMLSHFCSDTTFVSSSAESDEDAGGVLSLLKELTPPESELESLLADPLCTHALYYYHWTQTHTAKPHVGVCVNGSKAACGDRSACQNMIHFERLVHAATDQTSGDCSYLDTCFKGKQCKFVHYKIDIPRFWTEQLAALQFESQHTSGSPSDKDILDAQLVSYTGIPVPVSSSAAQQLAPVTPARWIRADIKKLDLAQLGQFHVIVADPPWGIHVNTRPRNPSLAVPSSLSDDEMLNLDLSMLQTEGVFFLWATNRALDVGRQCLRKWGYSHIEEVLWIKTNQLGRTICTGRTGHWLNHSKEHLLVAVKGSPAWLMRNMDVDVIVSVARENGRKPDELYGIIDRLAGPSSRKLELFGCNHNIRDGWLTIGSQIRADLAGSSNLHCS